MDILKIYLGPKTNFGDFWSTIFTGQMHFLSITNSIKAIQLNDTNRRI